MQNILRSLFCIGLLCSFLATTGVAQDLHFSQYYQGALALNPALAGTMDGDFRFAAQYRRQWYSVPVPYMTLSGAYDQTFSQLKLGSGQIAGGLLVQHDQQGDAALTFSQIALIGSYLMPVSESGTLSFGVQLGGAQRSFDESDLRFGAQFNGDQFDNGLSNQENFSNTSRTFVDLGVGVNYHYFGENRLGYKTNVHMGGGVHHLNRPDQNFLDQAPIKLPMRFNIYVDGIVEISGKSNFIIGTASQMQNGYVELLTRLGYGYKLPPVGGEGLTLSAGTAYRFSGTSDAIIPFMLAEYGPWTFGFSYDINISEFTVATGGNGGPELSLVYVMKRVPPVKTFKACPIF